MTETNNNFHLFFWGIRMLWPDYRNDWRSGFFSVIGGRQDAWTCCFGSACVCLCTEFLKWVTQDADCLKRRI